jgi:hypothetical protein
MTNTSLAASYLTKARARLKILPVLQEASAYSDVVREAQEIVELALKGVLRHVGVEPPKWHDVGGFLLEHRSRLTPADDATLARLAAISAWLRKEREFEEAHGPGLERFRHQRVVRVRESPPRDVDDRLGLPR